MRSAPENMGFCLRIGELKLTEYEISSYEIGVQVLTLKIRLLSGKLRVSSQV